MRLRSVLLLGALVTATLGAGCFEGSDPAARAERAIAACADDVPVEHILHFGPALGLYPAPQPSGFAPGNAFSSGFLTNDLKEWLSAPAAEGLWLVGNVTLEYWVRSTGTPAPLIVGGEPGEGYHFFNQFGSDRSLQPAYAVEYSEAFPAAGTLDHYVETLVLDGGGFVVEKGDRVRVLLTDLALEGANGGGHDVLFGGGTPSQVRFTARCFPELAWTGDPVVDSAVVLAGNQGLLFGGLVPDEVPTETADQANRAEFPVQLPEGTQRVTITIEQTSDPVPVKDDIDLELLDRSGQVAYSIGSPYSDEQGVLWLENLALHFPDGSFTVRVNSYSGLAYQGHLVVLAEQGAPA